MWKAGREPGLFYFYFSPFQIRAALIRCAPELHGLGKDDTILRDVEIMNRADDTYRVWAHDNQVYGPVDLPLLIHWVKEGRVLKATWVYLESNRQWRLAEDIAPLHT